ncbi:MAG: hypothetical protein JXR36_04760 [Bacteroidales bacterium]|nr:hypothetical protein [Bacteroidales bacterium]
MKVNKLIIILSIIIIGFASCKSVKPTTCENAVPAKLKNMHGMDGCGWGIELKNGQTLEPVNLNAFEIEKKDKKKIWITYESADEYHSICMSGPMIKIKCLSER